jgi:hypothetical protein
MEHPAQRHPIDDAAVDAKPNHATCTLVHYDDNPMWRIRSGTNRNSTNYPSCGRET